MGYVVREGRSVGSDRIVFVDDYLFMLHNWENKDNYEVRFVLKAPKMAGDDPEAKGEKRKRRKKASLNP